MTSRGSPRSIASCSAVDARAPTPLVVSLGVDAAVDDPAAPLMITAGRLRGRRRSALAALGLPTVFVQEGGYDLERLVPLVLEVLGGFEQR